MYMSLKIKLQKSLDSYIKERITLMKIAADKSTLLTYMHLNYANIAWVSTHKTKLKKV